MAQSGFWKRCGENFPQENQLCLVHSRFDGVGVASYKGCGLWQWTHKLINGSNLVSDVTHYIEIDHPKRISESWS